MDFSNFAFRGLMAPVFTPFNEDRTVNLKLIPDYAKYLHEHEIKGVLVNGTTGEGVSMTTEERKAVLNAWMKASQPYGLTVMAQVGGTNMSDVKSLARHAEAMKASAILCLADLFFRPSSVDDLLKYLNIVSQAAPNTPLLYYHIPSFTGINMNMKELLERRKEVSTLAGIKFTDGNLIVGSACVTEALKESAVFLGSDTLLLPALIQGFDSAIGTTINVFPDLNNLIYRYFSEGDIKSATAEQKILNRQVERITAQGPWVSSMKAAMRRLTPIDVGPVREPLIDINPDKMDLN